MKETKVNLDELDDGSVDYLVGIKHLIECNCVLPQFQNTKSPLFHKFIVFSIVDEENKTQEKNAICNNCGIVHTILEIGKSEITKSENLSSLREIKDIRIGLPPHIVNILEENQCDLATFEEVEFILDNERWGSYVVINKDQIEGRTIGKALIFKENSIVKIESFTRQDIFEI